VEGYKRREQLGGCQLGLECKKYSQKKVNPLSIGIWRTNGPKSEQGAGGLRAIGQIMKSNKLDGAGRTPNCLAAGRAGAGAAARGANTIPLERRNQPQAKIAGGTFKRGQTMAKG
jgi:hypothetical protein